MKENDFRNQVQNCENKSCKVVTTAGVYDGVFLRIAQPQQDLLMVLRATGKTREILEHVTSEGIKFMDADKEFGIPVELIEEIEF